MEIKQKTDENVFTLHYSECMSVNRFSGWVDVDRLKFLDLKKYCQSNKKGKILIIKKDW